MSDVLKLNIKHFKFVITYRKIVLASWKDYYARKAVPLKDRKDSHKVFLKQFRAQMKKSEYKYTVIHKPSGISGEFVVESLDRKVLMEKVRASVKSARSKLRSIKTDERYFDGARYQRVGGVFVQPKQINEIGKNTTTNDPFADKTPRPKKNYIGVELEFTNNIGGRIGDIGETLRNAGLAKYVNVTTDPSCGFEVRVLLAEEEFEDKLPKIMAVITKMGYQTNANCGTHVHFDMRHRDVKKVYKNLFYTQGFLRKFLTRDRKNNKYCRLNQEATYDAMHERQRHSGDRYYGINTLSYPKHKTLEIRMHHGTLDPNVIVPYIKMLLKVINYDAELKGKVSTLKQARAQYGIEPELSSKLAERIGSIFGRVLGA